MIDDKLLEKIRSGSAGFADDFFGDNESFVAEPAKDDDKIWSDDELWYGREETIVRVDFLSFLLGDKEYALPLSSIRSVENVTGITAYPSDRSYMLGGFQSGSGIYPLIDIGDVIDKQFGCGGKIMHRAKIALVQHESRMIGLLLQQVARSHKVDLSQLMAVPDEIGGQNRSMYDSVVDTGNGMLYSLSIPGIFSMIGE